MKARSSDALARARKARSPLPVRHPRVLLSGSSDLKNTRRKAGFLLPGYFKSRALTRRFAPPSPAAQERGWRSEEHTSELQSLMRISYAVFCLKKKNKKTNKQQH